MSAKQVLIDFSKALKETFQAKKSIVDTASDFLVKLSDEDFGGGVTPEQMEAVTGDLDNLETTSKTDLVSAINEVNTNEGTNATAIGDLTDLDTTVKTDLVSAVNEVVGNTSYKEIATAAENQTYATQLGYIKTFYDALSETAKLRAKLICDGYVYNLTHTNGAFTSTISATTGTIINTMRLDQQIFTNGSITSSNTVTWLNYSTSTNTKTIKLVLV